MAHVTLNNSGLEQVTEENSEFMKTIEEFKHIALQKALAKYQKPFVKAIEKIFKKTTLSDEDKAKIEDIKEKHQLAILEKFGDLFDNRILASEKVQTLLNQLFELQQMFPYEEDIGLSSELCPVRLRYYPKLQEIRKMVEERAMTVNDELQDCESELFEAQAARKKKEVELVQKLMKFEGLMNKMLESDFAEVEKNV